MDFCPPMIQRLDEPFAYARYIKLQAELRKRRREILFVCEHSPVITSGVKARDENLKRSARSLETMGIEIFRAGRGGDFTAHEPGQKLLYAHLDLQARNLGITRLFSELLDISAECLQRIWNINTHTIQDAPGLYVVGGAKILSIGLQFKSFFSSHGLALNLKNDLKIFEYIHACGDPNLKLTTVAMQGGHTDLFPEFLALWYRLFLERMCLPAKEPDSDLDPQVGVL